MNNDLPHHHSNEPGLTDDCSGGERFCSPNLEFLNICSPHNAKIKVKNKSPNLEKYTSSPQSENCQTKLEHFAGASNHCHSSNVTPNTNQDKVFCQRKEDCQQNINKCQLRSKLTQPHHNSGERAGTSQEHRSPTREYLRQPSLVDRRMEFLFSDKGNIEGETQHQQKKSVNFPFTQTPSGHYKILPDQVAFSSKKMSVLVADPNDTKVNIKKYLENSNFKDKMNIRSIPSKLFQASQNIAPNTEELMSKMRQTGNTSDMGDAEVDDTDNLKPEMKLERLGYSNSGSIDYGKLELPIKTNLYHELFRRITNYVNSDLKVIIGQEEFSCHAIVLQIYSEFFDNNRELHRIELPENEVSVNAFVIIYDWMITGKECITLLKRDNILELFIAARYLVIKELEEQCWAFLDSEDIFFEDTAFMLYLEAKKLNIPSVKELMIPRIRNFFLMLVSSQDFIELDIEEVCVLLSSNYIAINCEMEVLMSGVRWMKADWNNRLKYLVTIMSCVRFGLIAPWQLVDIKRNPKNPELLEIISDPVISKMVDDGLSYVIIKYWYGHQTDDYAHWIELLGLSEPQERNWAGQEKNYVTYRQFVAFLDTYRRENLLEKNKIKAKKDVNACSYLSPREISSSPPSSRRDYPTNHPKTFSNTPSKNSNNPSVVRCSSSRSFTEDEAAMRIQEAYRNYRSRKNSLTNIGANKTAQNTRTSDGIRSQNFRVLSMFAPHTACPEKKTKANLSYQKYLVKGSLFSQDRECVLVFGGMDPHATPGVNRNTGKDIYRYIPETNCWDFVGELPEPRQHHSTAFFRGRIYVAGGANPISHEAKDKAVVVNTVWSYEPITRTWFREPELQTARKNFGFVVSHMKLYAIGGQDKNGRMLASVERFEPGGTWEEVAPLKTPRMGMACAKYRDYIWVAGGMCGSKRNPLSSIVECYDTRKNEWTQIENLRFPRCFSCLFTMNDKLYLIGGAGRLSEKDRNTTSVSAVDVWDPVEKDWKLKTELAIPRHGHTVAYLGTQILVIGGVTTVYMRALSNTECYCCERNTWVRGISPLPTTLSGHSSVTLPPASLM